jgi:hypothetical protein
VAEVEPLLLRPGPDLLHGLALRPFFGGQVDQQALSHRGAAGVHGGQLPLRVLGGKLLHRHCRGLVGAAEPGGKDQKKDVLPLTEKGLHHGTVSFYVGGGGGGCLPLADAVVKLGEANLPAVQVVGVFLSPQGKGEGKDSDFQLPGQLRRKIAGRIGKDDIILLHVCCSFFFVTMGRP